MLTRSSEYALQAMIFLAQHSTGELIPGNRIATHTNIPRKYLSKILADMVRAGILTAAPGKTGGFRIARPPEKILLYEVLVLFEPVLANRRPCPFGNIVCNDDDPCAGHDRWRRVQDAYKQFLNETTVYDIAVKQNDNCSVSSMMRESQ